MAVVTNQLRWRRRARSTVKVSMWLSNILLIVYILATILLWGLLIWAWAMTTEELINNSELIKLQEELLKIKNRIGFFVILDVLQLMMVFVKNIFAWKMINSTELGSDANHAVRMCTAWQYFIGIRILYTLLVGLRHPPHFPFITTFCLFERGYTFLVLNSFIDELKETL